MLLQISLLQVGIIVPLAILVFFVRWYVKTYKKYLTLKRECFGGVIFADLFKNYRTAFLAYEQCFKSTFWFLFFGERYLNLRLACFSKALAELDRIDQFMTVCEFDHPEGPSIERTSFLYHWEAICEYLYGKPYFDAEGPYAENEEDPLYYGGYFGELNVPLRNKIAVLTKKHALYLLRKFGYKEFSGFLRSLRTRSKDFSYANPFSIVSDANMMIIEEAIIEMCEKIQAEIAEIHKGNPNQRAMRFRELLESYALSKGMTKRLPECFAARDNIKLQLNKIGVRLV